MKPFWETLVRPMLLKLEPTVVMEVGSFRGDNTELLAGYCQEHGATLHAVDPVPQFDVDEWVARYDGHFVFHRAKSLDILGSLEPAEVVLIDGDHNWYTVYHELKQLAEAVAAGGRPYPLVLFHDIGWPYARRDLYYDPADIPSEFRLPHQKNGILPGRSRLHPDGINGVLFNAEREGGPRNGVLTAIEDFVRESEEPLRLLLIQGFRGLGVLYPASVAERAPALGAHLAGLEAGLALLGEHIRELDDRFSETIVRIHRRRNREARLEAENAAAS